MLPTLLKNIDNNDIGSQIGEACEPGLFLIRDHCVDVCPDGWFPLQQRCEVCHRTCASCHGGEENSCTECYHGFQLLDGVCAKNGELDTSPHLLPGIVSRIRYCQVPSYSTMEGSRVQILQRLVDT